MNSLKAEYRIVKIGETDHYPQVKLPSSEDGWFETIDINTMGEVWLVDDYKAVSPTTELRAREIIKECVKWHARREMEKDRPLDITYIPVVNPTHIPKHKQNKIYRVWGRGETPAIIISDSLFSVLDYIVEDSAYIDPLLELKDIARIEVLPIKTGQWIGYEACYSEDEFDIAAYETDHSLEEAIKKYKKHLKNLKTKKP